MALYEIEVIKELSTSAKLVVRARNEKAAKKRALQIVMSNESMWLGDDDVQYGSDLIEKLGHEPDCEIYE